MSRYEVHEFANLVPAMSDQEYEAFREDIRVVGLREAITLYEGKILDGRHRQGACDETNTEPRYTVFEGDRIAAITLVVSANIHRRQLTSSQRAILAVGIEESIAAEVWRRRNSKISASKRRVKDGPTSDDGDDDVGDMSVKPRQSRVRSSGIAGKIIGVGESQIAMAKKLSTIAKSLPLAGEMASAVRDGKVSLNAGAALARKLDHQEVTVSQARQILTTAIAQPSAAKAGYAIINGIRGVKNAKREKLQSARPDGRRISLHLGRFQDADIPDASVDWIITDPPYGTKYVDMYQEFSDWSARVLRPGGSAFVMIGQGALDRTLPALCQSLKYLWTVGHVLQPGSPFTPIPSLFLVSGWKPVIWLCNGPKPNVQFTNIDAYISKASERDKTGHAWQQGQGFFDWLVSKFTLNTQSICDPFLGMGTTGVACKKFGRHFVGIEVDKDRFEVARAKINGTATLTVAG